VSKVHLKIGESQLHVLVENIVFYRGMRRRVLNQAGLRTINQAGSLPLKIKEDDKFIFSEFILN
jgi:hypothetical protein